MGVKDVWNVAGPCEERVSLHTLRGSILAIDLAGWVVQNQTAPGVSHSVTRPHLRNLFFRLNTLLSLDILPVVVLEGACPKAKAATVIARNQARGLPGTVRHPSIDNSPKRQERRQFGGQLRDCQSVAASIGVPCITAPGEAEAYCSWLNKAGLVDAVVSDDSDCFCYGATTVLRHFSTDPKQFSVSRYYTSSLREDVGLSRQRMVIMALILGCDYNPGGVCGVGKEALMRLFTLWGDPDNSELDRVLGWELCEEDRDLDKKPVHCGTCGHPGSVGTHRNKGCDLCSTEMSCVASSGQECSCQYHSQEHQLLLAEWTVKKKAMDSPGWPPVQVVKEFYRNVPTLQTNKFIWAKPRPADFLKVAVSKMNWLRDYSVERVTETVVRWQVKNCVSFQPLVSPLTVIKKRVKGGENMLEVEWSSCQSSNLPTTVIACVPSTEFSEAYPIVYQQHLDAIEAKAAGKKKGKKKKLDKENDPPKEKKQKAVKKSDQKQPTIEKFLNNDGAEGSNGVEDSIDTIIHKPKNVIFKKLVSTDDKFNNKVKSTKFVTPKEVEKPHEDLIIKDRYSNCDSYVLKSNEMFSYGIAASNEDTNIMTDSMREYLDSDDEMDLSQIVNDIVGAKKKPNNVLNLMDMLTNLSIHTPSSLTPKGTSPKSIQTSTPAFFGNNSPALRHIKQSLRKTKSSAVFDMDISDCNFLVEEENRTVEMIYEEDKIPKVSENTFNFDDPSETPFAERVRKRMNNL